MIEKKEVPKNSIRNYSSNLNMEIFQALCNAALGKNTFTTVKNEEYFQNIFIKSSSANYMQVLFDLRILLKQVNRDNAFHLITKNLDHKQIALNLCHSSELQGVQLIRFLTFFDEASITDIVSLCNFFERDLKCMDDISNEIKHRAITISRHIEAGYSYDYAYTKTDKDFQKLLWALMLLRINANDEFNYLPFEIVSHIITLGADKLIDNDDAQTLLFNMTCAGFSAQLSTYHSGFFPTHKERAISFNEAVSEVKDGQELNQLVVNQVKLLEGNNPYEEQNKKYQSDVVNKTTGGYHQLIGLWSKTLANVEPQWEKEETNQNCCIQ